MSAPDRIDGAPHPRETETLFGQAQAEAAFLDTFLAGRLHHAWLLTGPRGIGKATLAWRIARFLLATPLQDGAGLFEAASPPASLSIAPEHRVSRLLRAGAEPGLMSITRTVNDKTGRLRDVISVEDIRRLTRFFQLSASDGGRRVVIVDAADDMNPQAANALLKMLEEPPERATLLLIAHQPSRLLPTIRSRCRTLRLSALGADALALALEQAGVENVPTSGPEAVALAELSGGSVGAAVRLALLDGPKTYARLLSLVKTLPQMDRAGALKLAEGATARGAEAHRDLLFDLLQVLLARLARTGACAAPPAAEAAPGEAGTLLRLAPDPQAGRAWAQTAQEAGARVQHGLAVNLDPAALVLDTLFRISRTRAT